MVGAGFTPTELQKRLPAAGHGGDEASSARGTYLAEQLQSPGPARLHLHLLPFLMAGLLVWKVAVPFVLMALGGVRMWCGWSREAPLGTATQHC